MNRWLAAVVLIGAASVFAASPLLAQELARLDSKSARKSVAPRGQSLAPPSTAGNGATVVAFLRGRGLDAATASSLRGAGERRAAGMTHVTMEQEVDGLKVYGTYVKAAFNSAGALVHVIENVAQVSAGGVVGTRIGEAQALDAALRQLYPGQAFNAVEASRAGHTTTFSGGSFFHRGPTVTAAALPMSDNVLRAGFLVETWSQAGNQLHHTVVGGDGRVLFVESRTSQDSYNVFVEDPGKGAQTVVAGPGGGNAESPAGWLGTGSQTTVNITGNNAHSYLDTDANNAADGGGTAVSGGNFLSAADLSQQPSTTANKNVAVQNLFYLTNVVHDILYRHGFDEAAGNFQADNFGNGGQGNDPVNAEAQDGSGLDNANFATPADGSSPRMQMFLWSGITPTALVSVGGTDYGAYTSVFGAAPSLAGVPGSLALYDDATGTTTDGCEASVVPLTGKIVIVDRGTCNFTVKVLNAQKAGAAAVVIANNTAGNAFSPGGTEHRIRIPSAMVSQADGATLKGLVGAAATLRKNPADPLRIDGDLDSDVVYHEYGHGLTWRMIGGMSGKLAGAIGEGASDVNAFLINGDPIIGEYAFADPAGIRRNSYQGYPRTYKDVTGAEVHDDGEIYAAAMWRVLQNYLIAGLTVSDVQDDFVDGMNFTPATPAFEDMRDGMLQSAAGTGRECLIWNGFAATGIGVGADGTVSKNGRNVTIVESFTVPAACQ